MKTSIAYRLRNAALAVVGGLIAYLLYKVAPTHLPNDHPEKLAILSLLMVPCVLFIIFSPNAIFGKKKDKWFSEGVYIMPIVAVAFLVLAMSSLSMDARMGILTLLSAGLALLMNNGRKGSQQLS